MQKSDLKKPTNHNIQKPETAFCLWCWRNRTITTNGKCFVCGVLLVSQQHWQNIIDKMKIIAKHRDGIPLEIKRKMYIVPFHYFEDLQKLTSPKEEAMFVEKIKSECKSYTIKG